MAAKNRKCKVLLCVTHKDQYNGYSLVGYELARRVANHPDIQLSIYGFQRFYEAAPGHRTEMPACVDIYDAWAHENPKGTGFGFGEIEQYVMAHRPDVVVLYNDLMVVTELLKGLNKARAAGAVFKVVTLFDQVYLSQRRDLLTQMHDASDTIITFSKFWEDVFRGQHAVTKPTCYVHHGIDPMKRFPVNRVLARKYFNLRNDDWIILNLNRNQPRKRWDVCIQAFAEVLKTHHKEPIKLLVGTAVQGAWNILEIYERELRKRGLDMQEGMKHIVLLDNPQRMTDAAINVLNSSCDIGINCCDGEGWGLTCFEQAAVGIPQVASRVGGHKEFFDDDCALLVDPKMTYYVDHSRDSIGGEAQLCDYRDFAAKIIEYYENNALRSEHGRRARERILSKYHWDRIAHKFSAILLAVHRGQPVDNIDDDGNVTPTLASTVDVPAPAPPTSASVPAPAVTSVVVSAPAPAPASPVPAPTSPVPAHASHGKHAKSKKKKKDKDKDTLRELKSHLDKLLANAGG